MEEILSTYGLIFFFKCFTSENEQVVFFQELQLQRTLEKGRKIKKGTGPLRKASRKARAANL